MAFLQTLLRSTLLAASLSGALHAHIAPTRLEANLGILPIDIYTTPQFADVFPGATSCHTVGGITPRTCVQQFLTAYKNMGVTGIRFQFALGDGQWTATPPSGPFYSSYSTPFTSTGGLNTAWNTNLALFFSDVKTAGMSLITPYTVMMYYWSGYGNPTFESVQTLTDCNGVSQTYYLYPWLPFGLTPSSAVLSVPGYQDNSAWSCAPSNPTFWGWTPYLNLVAEICSDAVAAGLTIEDFEIEAEIDLFDYPLSARLVFDNTWGVPVRRDVAIVLNAYGFNAGAATYSVQAVNPNAAGADCMSIYGENATVIYAVELLAGLGGGLIGVPTIGPPTNGLECGGTIGTMFSIPSQSLPNVTDVHVYPCVIPPGSATQSCAWSPNVTSTAQNIYNDIYGHLSYRGLLSNLVMIGETSSNQPIPYTYCDPTSSALSYQNAAGYLSSDLYLHIPSTTVLRPWGWITSPPGTCQTPSYIGAPLGPYEP